MHGNSRRPARFDMNCSILGGYVSDTVDEIVAIDEHVFVRRPSSLPTHGPRYSEVPIASRIYVDECTSASFVYIRAKRICDISKFET